MDSKGANEPGMYLLAHFRNPPNGRAEPDEQEIIYIGETCDNILWRRWRQFDRAAFGNGEQHGGGITYSQVFSDQGGSLYVAAFPVRGSNRPGHAYFIRYVERKPLWNYVRKWGRAPRCNTK